MPNSETTEDEGLPWMSWALTGVSTLAVVLIAGLVISAWHPPAEPVARQVPPARPAATSGAAGVRDSSTRAAVAAPVATAVPTRTLPSDSPIPTAPSGPLPSTAPPAATGSPARPSVSPPPLPLPPPTGPKVVVESNPSPPAVAEAPPDPARRGAFVRAVADVRQSLARRDLAAAKRHVQTAAANVQTPAEKIEFERLEILQVRVEEFWKGIREAVGRMQPVDEIVLTESNRVAVIEADRDMLAVQMEGRPHRFRIDAIPMNLLSAIAKSSFSPTPGSKLVVGAFLAMDAQGDRAEARKLWQEALRGGENEARLLLPELDVGRK